MSVRRYIVAGPLALVLVASGAHAEEQTGTAQAAPAAGAPSADQTQRAQDEFKKGMELYDSKQYTEAIDRFEASYDAVPSPNSRLMVARCLRELGKVGQAYAMFEEGLVEAELAASKEPRYAHTAGAVREELAELRPRVGLIVVKVEGNPPAEATLTVGGRRVERAAWVRPVPTDPGEVTVVFVTPSGEKREVVKVEGGGTESVDFEYEAPAPVVKKEAPPPPEPKMEPNPTLRTGAYVSGIIGAAGLATFLTLLVLDGSDTIQTIGIVTGAVGIGVGIGLYIASEHTGSPAGPNAALVVGPRGVMVRGQF
jgi:hypothetical protein